MLHRIAEMCEGFVPSCETPMLRIFSPNPSSEHALFIRLFLTGGGGW
jgi:hypothetical protein